VPEETLVSDAVGTIVATDNDGGRNGTVSGQWGRERGVMEQERSALAVLCG